MRSSQLCSVLAHRAIARCRLRPTKKKLSICGASADRLGNAAARKTLGGMMSWLYEIAGRSQLALMWLVAVAIGAVIYFFPIARLLESLAE
jgi:hypothetical protein